MFTKKQLATRLVGAGLLIGLGAPAQAGYISSILTPGVDNIFSDQSREAYFDNGDGVFGVGDILTGFVRLDDKVGPDTVELNNQVYAIFSQEVVSVSKYFDTPGTGGAFHTGSIEFGPVTSDANLTLSGLGVAGAGAQDMVALYSDTGKFNNINMITAAPGDLTGNGTVTLADYLKNILDEGELELRAGLYDTPTCSGGTSDCFTAYTALLDAPNSLFIGAGPGFQVATFVGGFETSLDPAGFVLDDNVLSGAFFAPAFPNSLSQVALKNGAASGSGGTAFESFWIDGSELTNRGQCLTGGEKGQGQGQGEYVPCGFADDADFVVRPLRVPEPTTIALLGVSLLGFGVARRRQRRQQS